VTSYEHWSLIVSFVSLTLSITGFGALLWQLLMLARSTRLDHARRRTQATMEYLSATMDRRSSLREQGIPEDRDSAELAGLIDRSVAGDAQATKLIVEYLTIFNFLGVAAQSDAFDPAVIDQAWGGLILAVHRNYRPWIDNQRERRGEPRLYEDLEWLAARMTPRQIAPAPVTAPVTVPSPHSPST
jgi:hypothetical protein